jgi:hypothetical protein
MEHREYLQKRFDTMGVGGILVWLMTGSELKTEAATG